ncbi:MAG TPA: hypothetical protein VEH27_00645 [Methylomirabilota bacterium]|nr:hypothetical protein [Methylomirabilota bacterium]
MKAAYLGNPYHCPFCKGAHLHNDLATAYRGGEIVYDVSCMKCERSWKDVYTLTDVRFEAETERNAAMADAKREIPPPFTVEPYDVDKGLEMQRWAIRDAQGHTVAKVCAVGHTQQEVEERAKLFAAAPEMLGSLSALLRLIAERPGWAEEAFSPVTAQGEWLANARRVVAKAEGRVQ